MMFELTTSQQFSYVFMILELSCEARWIPFWNEVWLFGVGKTFAGWVSSTPLRCLRILKAVIIGLLEVFCKPKVRINIGRKGNKQLINKINALRNLYGGFLLRNSHNKQIIYIDLNRHSRNPPSIPQPGPNHPQGPLPNQLVNQTQSSVYIKNHRLY